MEKKKQTVGAQALEIIKSSDPVTPIEQMEEQLSDYDKNLFDTVEKYRKTVFDDFYIVVLTKKERLLPNVIRNYFFCRQSCPTPDYDQVVYKFIVKREQIVFMWVIPSKDSCEFIRDNALDLPKDQHQLIEFVLSFYDGTLLNLTKELNKEESDMSAIIQIAPTA